MTFKKLSGPLFFRTISVCLATVSLVLPAHADYVWLERDATGTVSAYLGDLEKGYQSVAGLVPPRLFLADGKDLALETQGERFVVPVVGSGTSSTGDLRLVTSRVTDKKVLNYYQARFGRTETKAVNDLEIVPTTPKGDTFKLLWKGSTVAATQVNVDTSEGWRRVLKSAKDGTVSFDPTFPGLYVLEVTAKVNGSVTVDGKKYDDVRHTATLSFEVVR
ncbi:DUF4198 domain-containing protein [Rhodoferax sp. U11-2br]|uniref:DUF4198 domain-containing protein n=1 Tax=Rhodoferax sp. U11-2br TaxID=2838878 RepID=UPI0020373C18|nr:DUF4198 domain-containing protein [Rhodoferax sp. U11-2br]